MAHLALVIDADRDRRDVFAAGVRRLFSELPDTVAGEVQSGSLSCLWVAGPHAPIDIARDHERVAVLIGYAVDDAGRWVTARELATAWLAPSAARVAHDGYHVGIAYDREQGFAAGGDPLGLFPLYHASLPDGSILVATSPLAFACHPAWSASIDRTGLAGILLAHGLLDDRPLMTGARRVAEGHRLRMPHQEPLREVEVFEFAGSEPPAGETFADTVERIDAELMAAVRRHCPPRDDAVLMLSGGLDSRLFAGCLTDEGVSVRAISFGRPRDYEVRAARLVAEQLQMPIEVVATEQPLDDFVAAARRAARFSQLSSAPSGDDFATGLAAATTRSPFTWGGIPLDRVLEPVSKHNGYDPQTGRWSSGDMLWHLNAWGVPVSQLPTLLGRDGHDLCRDLLQRLETSCTAGPLPPPRQSAVLRWSQRVRNHLGAALHLLSFSAWPLMPATDRRFFKAAFGLPLEMYAERGLEKAILQRRRPDLAALPIDTNSYRFKPLHAEPGNGVARAFEKLGRQLRRAAQPFLRGSDPRRYERVFNVDEPRWRQVRMAVEPLRPHLEAVLDADTLARLLPPAHRRLRSRSPLVVGSPIRLLAGLAFVLEEHGA